MKIRRPTCKSCIYWEPIPTCTTGYCKRESPRTHDELVVTGTGYFCGEHQDYTIYERAVTMALPKCASCKHLKVKSNSKLTVNPDYIGKCEILKDEKWRKESGCYLHEKVR